MSSEEEALLAAIRREPEDDTVRLVYADWLEESASTEEVPCPTCSAYQNDPDNPYGGLGYHPERSPASGRHEGGWTNCKSCNGSYADDVRPGFVRTSGRRELRAEFIRVQIELAQRAGTDQEREECSWGGTCACRTHELQRRERQLWGEGHPVCPYNTPDPNFNYYIESTCGESITPMMALLVRRGFVDLVQLPIARFVPLTCAVCNGFGGYCSGPCRGNRNYRTKGLAKALFSTHPITRVTLTDREPYHLEMTNQWRWFLGESDQVVTGEYTRAGIPNELFSRVYPNWPPPQRGPQEYHFTVHAAAVKALSDACVKYGREMAALP